MSSNTQIPMRMDVKIYPLHDGANVLAKASVTLNGCFAIRGIRVVDGKDGVFASMPSYKTREGYKNICFPCTKEFHQQFNEAVVTAYRQEMAQAHQQRSEIPQQQGEVPQQGVAPQEEPALEPEEPPMPQMMM
ncbi:SpoVG family protein [Pseudoflavonifractor sp. 60]|uniref:SpoVG family protein n=1 Tax=Pseudoflavonifractor sp. 60 TaxID=2304576 RepID=UPI00136836B4|nr:SpoVG family protein [Pseudoflavonifractor sp. 60]NBI65964.1 SpoVG family protein [Pseudoflavonifractor sp. 60]